MNEVSEMGKILPGFTSCPCCHIEKKPQEERMALPGEYDRVLCLSCLRSSNQLSAQLRKSVADLPKAFASLVVSLISVRHKSHFKLIVPYRLVKIEKGIARSTFVFSMSRTSFDETIRLSFPDDANFDLAKISAPAVGYAIRQSLPNIKIPGFRKKALKEILSKGFEILDAELDSCDRRIMLSFFQNDEAKDFSTALTAEIKWNAC